MAETAQVNPEPLMLIDGKLVESSTGTKFANVNPATEEVLGHVADASREDMRRAISAAPRLRRHRLVDQPVLAPALPRAAPRSPRRRARGDARAAHPRGRLPPHADGRTTARRSP